MSDEEQKTIEEPKEEEKPVSIVDEARSIRDEILEAKRGLKEEREKLEKVQTDNLLSGSAGGHIKPEPKKEETPKEYVERMEKQGWRND